MQQGNRSAGAVFRRAMAAALLAALAACGGGGGGGGASGGGGTPTPTPVVEKPNNTAEAARFLTQATFGPRQADVDHLMAVGYAAWIDEQFQKSPLGSHRAAYEAADAVVKAGDPNARAWQNDLVASFWKQAVTGDDQLRQRMAFALSQILVISMQDSTVGDNLRGVGAWLDMLDAKAFGNYRDMLEAVTLNPLMGTYLTYLHNQKADPKTGRVPDENYAREVMQLFSVGLVKLKIDGSPQLEAGQPVATYAPSDIGGLAKVFTGWSWACPTWPDSNCFYWGSSKPDPDRWIKPMVAYPAFHSTEAKAFLGTTIAAQTQADAPASLKAALDAIFNHPNVGPFIGRQLIQRFVTSNPSPAYVQAVAAAFNDNGSGVRGDLKATLKAVLMHPEARVISDTSGKVREPVLRLTAFLRAFPFKSDSGNYKVGLTDDPSSSLGQTPLRSPSVFNFFRPGYVPPDTLSSAANLVVPELQLANETSSAGYVNAMRDNVAYGVGEWSSTLRRPDLQPDYTAQLALADDAAKLVADVDTRLLWGRMPDALKAELVSTVGKITIPALKADKSNQTQVDRAKRARVNAALLLTLVSPEYQVQR